ncbi:putative bifunctional diguanylate cyclase/phosphodiesterase [Actinoplanes sp. NPDC051343]|uniref:putative bifunctional diguanylate cyclase/phosphodiesterase n=1 Tax=Actinoplanes sp. NPDC051343 TaxID=3363906 RepID=UPI0037B9CF00
MTREHRSEGGRQSALDALAHQWLRVITPHGFIPGRRARARERLRLLVQQLVDAADAQPFEPSAGARVGAALIEARMASPGVLSSTLTLLARRLPGLVGPGDPDRITALLGQLAYGFTTSLRDVVVEANEVLHRSMRISWADKQHLLQEQLTRARLHDPVTDLPNRVFLRERLNGAIRQAQPGERIGVCLIRIDDFADLNDTLGHRDGDLLLDIIGLRLREVVTSLAQGAPPTATQPGAAHRHLLAHLGGEQFVFMVTGTTGLDEMTKIAGLAQRAVGNARLPWIDDYELKVSMTAGIVERPAAGTDADAWLRDAHIALSWTHTEHRPYAVFDSDRAEQDLRRHRLAAAMPAALERGEFVPYYQPILQLTDRRIVGVEALARWQQRGHAVPLGPGEFIDAAERTGLIRPLGQTLLRQACHHGARWHADGHGLLISVNLSPLQLADPDLLAAITDILDASRLPADALQLEITESTAVDSPTGILNELADRGIRLAIDDFGTGHANLAALACLPVNTVKLAGELVTDLNDLDNAAAAAVVHRTIQLCHDLNVTVIAEGIETEAQYAALRAYGCDYGQGFLFARPAPTTDITAILRDQHNAGS